MTSIRQEAHRILTELGLEELLKGYGEPFVSGSYYLDLMTWRDLDIYIDLIEENRFFQLTFELAHLLKPHRINYRNEIASGREGKPPGLYSGLYANLLGEEWKIDLWGLGEDLIDSFKKESRQLKDSIHQQGREAVVLAIKERFCHHPLYRRQFFSMDIYNSVIHHGVQSVEGFSDWLSTNKGVNLR